MRSQEPAYQLVQNSEDREDDASENDAVQAVLQDRGSHRGLHLLLKYPVRFALGLFFLLFLLVYALLNLRSRTSSRPCYDAINGFNCHPEISHYWGPYSPFFSVPSAISPSLPQGCNVTFVQVLSRHGSRDPTFGKSLAYLELVDRIKTNVVSFPGKYAFIEDYTYSLGADQLTPFGQQELFDSGTKFYGRYKQLARSNVPFIRAGSQDRVVQSARNFSLGFHSARVSDDPSSPPDSFPYPILEISEDAANNNTLHHSLCDSFESGPDSSHPGSGAQQIWLDIFAPSITARLNGDLPGANFTDMDTIYTMDLCPFNTVASKDGKLSPFCQLFTEEEWKSYDYFQSLGKYYGYGDGNSLGPTQGVGFVNELIARMTNTPVEDRTSVNHTLDGSQDTFPLGSGVPLYADFSHDNDMTAIFAALGLYNATSPLSNDTMQDPSSATKGFSASWTVPFTARAYFEKMQCGDGGSGGEEEMVRVLVNDRVIPLVGCGADDLGRCTLSKFVDSLEFARSGGRWDDCFK